MKKILVLLLVLVLSLSVFASCEYLPDEVMDAVNPILDKIGIGDNTADVPDQPDDLLHEHSYTATTLREPNCSRPGKYSYTCSCGDTYETEEGEALGHNFKVSSVTTPSCTVDGGTKYKCSRCGYSKTDTTPATGHNFGTVVEMSRLIPCLNDNCPIAKLPVGDGKYKESIVYKFTDADLDRFNTIFDQLGALIEAADAYDATLHAYAPGSETEVAYLVMEAKYEELYDVLEYVTTQYQIAQLEYHTSMKDNKKEVFDYISGVRTDLISRFYSFSEAIYDSMFREYYYYGMSEEEIRAFIFDSNAISNPEYKALVDRNNEIELEFMEVYANADTAENVPTLYAEFVANNKRIAEIMGYDNYLEYAYENVYNRDYSYTDVKAIFNNVKQYLSSAYVSINNKFYSLIGANLTDTAYATYLTFCEESFFTTYESNKHLNDYVDMMAFTTNPNKVICFSDELNSLMGDGNLFRGQYGGAYVTKLYGLDIPIAYFGNSGSYSNSFTVAHEFGHYMNEIYNTENYSQSYDLLEMHSQGNEMLYLAYLKSLGTDVIPADGMQLVEVYQILLAVDSVINALAVDTFEQAVYTDIYDGAYSAKIMADGKITADEYDALYKSILVDLGVDGYVSDTYWRYMTITAPCYYISYSVSALSVLQIYAKAQTDFDGAQDSYLKLFSYVDELNGEDDYMSTEEVLEYAGLYSFTDEQLYKLVAACVKKVAS